MFKVISIKHQLTNLILLVFSSFCLLVGLSLCTCLKSQNKTGPESEIWSQLLASFEKHTEESRLFVKAIYESEDSSLEKKLAHVLLDEWNVDQKSKIFKSIRAIHIEPFKANEISEIGVTHILSAVVMKIDVDSNGKFIKGTFLKLKNGEFYKEKKMIINSLKESCFRPPFINGRFTTGSGIITIFLH